jgi:hypothetical protein
MDVSTVTSFGCISTSPSFLVIICGVDCPFGVDVIASFHRTTQPYLPNSPALASVEYYLQEKRDKVQRIWVRKTAQSY